MKKKSKIVKQTSELKVRWFCRNCHQQGLAGVLRIITSNDKEYVPPKDDLITMIRLTCHTNCDNPDIRIYHDTTSQLVH